MEPTTTEERITQRIDKQVTSELAIRPTGALAAANVEQLMELAKMMAVAQVAVPKHLRSNPGACLAIAIQASEWEMSPFAVANKSYVVNDRLSFEAQLINAVILRRAPIIGRFKVEYRGEGKTRRCKVWAKVRDPDTNEIEKVEYESPEIGTIPVQNSPLWKGDPDQQLFYYSSRAMCRRHFPDVILGIYTPEELAEAIDVPAQVRTIPDATIGQSRAIAEKTEAAPERFYREAQSVTEAAQQEQAAKKPEPGKEGDPSSPVTATETQAAPSTTTKPADTTQTTQDASKAAATSDPKPAANSGPTAKELQAQILKKARVLNWGKAVLVSRLVEAKYLEGGKSLEDLDAKTAANVLDAWDELVKEEIP